MQGHHIRISLGLPGLMVLGEREMEGAIEVVARYRDEEAGCPRCCRPTWQVHQWRGR